MSTGDNKAGCLSYASQDAEAAKRICDARRAAGVEGGLTGTNGSVGVNPSLLAK
jgi:hypothetical protein